MRAAVSLIGHLKARWPWDGTLSRQIAKDSARRESYSALRTSAYTCSTSRGIADVLDGPWQLTKVVQTHKCVHHAWPMQRCFPFSPSPYTLQEGICWHRRSHETAMAGRFPTSSIAKMPGLSHHCHSWDASAWMQKRGLTLKPCSRAHHCLGRQGRSLYPWCFMTLHAS